MGRRILAAAIILAGASAVGGQAVPPGTGLVAYWTLNDAGNPAALDTAGSGTAKHGTYMGTTLPVSSPLVPQAGGAAHPPLNVASRIFTQATSNQRVQVPDAADLNLTGAFTLAAWVRPTGTQTNQLGILEKFSGSPINGYFLRLSPTLRPFASLGNGATQVDVQAAGPIPAGVWTHLAATRDAAGNFRIYVNGGTPVTTTGTPAPTASTNPLHLGSDYGANRFDGHIDDARIYDRPLTATEVAVLTNGLPAPVLGAPMPLPNRIDLSWSAVPNATSYRVLRGSSATGPWTSLGATTLTSYTDTTALNPTPYWYQVVAVGVIESPPSNIQGPVVPQSAEPRTKDHDEGLIGDNCACGSSIPAGPTPWAALLLLLLGAAPRRRSS